MALDWNKELSLSTVLDLVRPGSKKNKGGAPDIPSKTTMNLYQVEDTATNVRKLVLGGILGVLVLALILKFGVVDLFMALGQKQEQLAQQEAILAEIGAVSSETDEITKLYEAYEKKYGSGGPDVIAVLDMVERCVVPRAKVTGITLADSILTLSIEDASLETVGDLASDLEKEPLVQSTNVSSASTKAKNDAQGTESTLVVMLKTPEAEKKE